MSNSNNILLLVKKHNEKLVAKYTNRINQLEAENKLLKHNNMEANDKLVVLTSENETLRKEFDFSIDLLTKYFDSFDDNLIPTTKLGDFNIDEPNEKLSFESEESKSRMLLNKLDKTHIVNESTPYKYLQRRHKSFVHNRRLPLMRRLRKYKSLNSQDSSDPDEEPTLIKLEKQFLEEKPCFSATKSDKLDYTTPSNTEPKIIPSQDASFVENTPINVLKKILTDDFSTSKNNKDASYSFNNMKPYIFTLDKNNKK